MYSVCHVTLQDRVTSLLYITTLPSGSKPCSSADITHLVFNMILQGHFVKGSYDFLGGSSSLYVAILPNLVTLIFVVVKM